MTPRAGLLLWVLASPGFAGTDQATGAAKSTPRSVPVIRISIDLVQVDAVVTDREGRHVTDLRPEDFTILENGEPQKIAKFAFVEVGARASTDADVAEGSTPRLRAPRTIVFVFDDLGVSFFSAAAAQSALKKFAREPFVPGDHVALVRTAQDESSYPFFESNEALFAAASKLRANLRSASLYDETNPFEAVMRYDAFSHRVQTLIGTVDGLRGLPGRKAVVLLSEGFYVSGDAYHRHGLHSVYDSLFSDDDVQSTIRLMIEVANRASVVIYAIDPRGLEAYSGTADDSDSRTAVDDDHDDARFASQGTLHDLAAGTGGLTVVNHNDLVGGLRRIVADHAGYYLIGYEPPSSTFNKKAGKPRFHSVKVKVDRPDLKVRSRSGFYGLTDDEIARRAPKP